MSGHLHPAAPCSEGCREPADSAGDAIRAMGPQKFNEILQMPKGSRPDPASYLPKEYIENHLAKFDDGAAKFISKTQFEKWGPAQIDGTAFVIPGREADRLFERAAGNKRVLERALGFETGFLDKEELLRIDIPEPRKLSLRVPSGREAGANPHWIPGGKLPDGNVEAVIDLGTAPAGSWKPRALEI